MLVGFLSSVDRVVAIYHTDDSINSVYLSKLWTCSKCYSQYCGGTWFCLHRTYCHFYMHQSRWNWFTVTYRTDWYAWSLNELVLNCWYHPQGHSCVTPAHSDSNFILLACMGPPPRLADYINQQQQQFCEHPLKLYDWLCAEDCINTMVENLLTRRHATSFQDVVW